MENYLSRTQNIELLKETLVIMQRGYYEFEGEKRELKLSDYGKMLAYTFLPDKISELREDVSPLKDNRNKRVNITLSKEDTLTSSILMQERTHQNVALLNFANPYSPGGGVRYGCRAQEEDICRKSSLLISLESEKARPYYEYNEKNENFMASDAVIISPKVEVIKDAEHKFYDDSKLLSVITCPAPMLMNAPINFDFEDYKKKFIKRIDSILLCAAYMGYRNLVLGAFGCGAFKNQPEDVALFFKEAFQNFRYKDMDIDGAFDNIEFAILTDYERPSRNYTEFEKVFKK